MCTNIYVYVIVQIDGTTIMFNCLNYDVDSHAFSTETTKVSYIIYY